MGGCLAVSVMTAIKSVITDIEAKTGCKVRLAEKRTEANRQCGTTRVPVQQELGT